MSKEQTSWPVFLKQAQVRILILSHNISLCFWWPRLRHCYASLMVIIVWVNDHLSITGGPFGGFKWSGFGRELGSADINAYTEIQTVRYAK